MTFSSPVVQAEWNQNNLVLKRGTSLLIIEAKHIQNLRDLQELQEFSSYFRTQALVNRAARRVFESWERKDQELLAKVKKEVTT